MSHKADIDSVFDELIEKIPAYTGDILVAKFEVFEALEWDSSAAGVVKEMLRDGYSGQVDGNMMAYIRKEE